MGDRFDSTWRLRLAAWFRDHDGVITAPQLDALGIHSSTVPRLVSRGELVRVYKGVYRSPAHLRAPEVDLRAAWLAAGAGGAAALISSAHRQGLLQWPPRRPQIARRGNQGVTRRRGFTLHRFSDLEARHCVMVRGILCTSPERTIADLAGDTRTSLKKNLVRASLRAAVKADASVVQRLYALDEERGPRAGRRLLRQALDELPGTEILRSFTEIDFLVFCEQYGLPLPETNVMIEGFEVDAAWRFARLIAEVDTPKHHTDPLAFERDRMRDMALTTANWRVVRVTPDRFLRTPVPVAEQFRTLLAQRPTPIR